METVRDALRDSRQPVVAGRHAGAGRRVLFIEDDPQIGRLVATELREAGHEVELAVDGSEGVACYEQGDFDLIMLDLMLPGLDGLEICRRVRANCGFTPIIMISAKAAMGDIVRGLELGADEYMTKPFAVPELMARINALFRRIAVDHENGTSGASITRQGALVIDPRKHEVRIDNVLVALTAKEFDLLHMFARNPGCTFSRAELLNVVWGVEFEGYEHTVNTHINRLRKKIDRGRSVPPMIETVWGVGYRLREPPL